MNMNNGKQNAATGVGFVGMLQLILITLRICDIIQWSWAWVLTPTWISAVLVILLLYLIFRP